MVDKRYLDKYLSTFGKFLEYKRLEKGMSSYAFNGVTGVSGSAIRFLEKRERYPTLEMVVKLSHGLNMTPSEFLKELEDFMES